MSSKKPFSTIVDENLAHKLKLYLLERNIPINKWFTEVIESTLCPNIQKDSEVTYPVLESHPADKKDWLMANLDNAHTINAIKSGCEEWLQLIKLWNRGDLQYEKLKAVIAQ